jgi:hypothetical protein
MTGSGTSRIVWKGDELVVCMIVVAEDVIVHLERRAALPRGHHLGNL